MTAAIRPKPSTARYRARVSVKRAMAACISLISAATVVHAQGHALSTYGARIGISINPDQVTLGGYGTIPDLAPNLIFRPSGDVGFGNDVLTLVGNADVLYIFNNVTGRSVPFFGGGLAILWFDPDNRGSDTEVGLNIVGGVELEMQGYKTGVLELRIGLDDQIPDFKITYGFGFY